MIHIQAYPIIVVGGSHKMLDLFRFELRFRSKIFFATMSEDLACQMVKPGEKQLLITCDLPQNKDVGRELARKMQEKNPKLLFRPSTAFTGQGDRINSSMLDLALRSVCH